MGYLLLMWNCFAHCAGQFGNIVPQNYPVWASLGNIVSRNWPLIACACVPCLFQFYILLQDCCLVYMHICVLCLCVCNCRIMQSKCDAVQWNAMDVCPQNHQENSLILRRFYAECFTASHLSTEPWISGKVPKSKDVAESLKDRWRIAEGTKSWIPTMNSTWREKQLLVASICSYLCSRRGCVVLNPVASGPCNFRENCVNANDGCQYLSIFVSFFLFASGILGYYGCQHVSTSMGWSWDMLCFMF